MPFSCLEAAKIERVAGILVIASIHIGPHPVGLSLAHLSNILVEVGHLEVHPILTFEFFLPQAVNHITLQ